MAERRASRIAYQLAEERIAEAKAGDWRYLNLSGYEGSQEYFGERRIGDEIFRSLVELPPSISDLISLHRLDLDNTQIQELSALKHLSELRCLYVNSTNVTDLSALSSLPNLRELNANNTHLTEIDPLSGSSVMEYLGFSKTKVSDLSPATSMPRLKILFYRDTRAVELYPELKLLSALEDHRECTRKTLEWLRTNAHIFPVQKPAPRPEPENLTEARETSGKALEKTPRHSESDYEVTDNGERLTEKPLPGDIPDLDDPYRMRQQADRLSTLSDLARELFNDIKADQPNVPDALRRDLKRYADEMNKAPGAVRPQYLRSRMKVFVIAHGDEDVRMGLGAYALAKFEELIDEHNAVMAAFYGAQIERLRQREEEPLTADATPAAMEEALDQAITLTSGPDWAHYPTLPDSLSQDLIHWRDTLRDEQLKLLLKPDDAARDGATRLAIDNRVYVATVGQAVGRAVEWVAEDERVRATANLGSATGFLQMLGRILGF